MAWGFAAFFLGYGAYYLAGFVLGAFVPAHSTFDAASPPNVGPLLLLAFAPNLLLGVVPALFSWLRGSGPRVDFGVLPTWRDVKVGLACGGSALAASGIVAVVVVSVSGPPPQTGLSALMGQERSIWLVLFVLFAFLGAPLTEELLVRGALWGALEHHRVPRYAILLLTALIFAFLHAEAWRMPILFVGGVALGVARMITGRIGASMVAHATNNFLPALVLLLAAG
ncbi:lysostaphin resistance A-like protein [Parasphingorhabdus pacifica]